MERVLIGVGCSHTQGCACINGVGTEHQEYELASIQLKHKYKKQKGQILEESDNIKRLKELMNNPFRSYFDMSNINMELISFKKGKHILLRAGNGYNEERKQ